MKVSFSGRCDVFFVGLPEKLSASDVYVESGSNQTELTIHALSEAEVVKEVLRNESSQVLELEAEVEDMQWQLEHLERNVSRLSKLAKALDDFLNVSSGHELPTLTDSFTFYDRSMKDLDVQLLEAYRAKAKLTKKILHARGTIEELKKEEEAKNGKVRALVVDLQVGPDSTCTTGAESGFQLSLRYFVLTSGWAPSYDFHYMSSKENLVEMVQYGLVWQSTGEDWSGVPLTLSMATPAEALSPPKVQEQFVAFHVHSDGEAQGSSGGPAMAGVTWQIPGLVSLRANGKPLRAVAARVPLRASFTHYATPSVSEHVYLRATMNNTGAHPLIPSVGNRVFVDGRRVGTTNLSSAVRVHGKFSAFLGIDPAVKIIVAPEVQRKSSSFSLTEGFAEVMSVSRGCQVLNGKDVPLRILLKDAVVQSGTDEIQVALVHPRHPSDSFPEIDPAGLAPGDVRTHLSSRSGEISWGACIRANGELNVPLEYTVTYPRGRDVRFVLGATLQHGVSADTYEEAHAEL